MEIHCAAVVSWVPLERLSPSAWGALNIPETGWRWLHFLRGRADEKAKERMGRVALAARQAAVCTAWAVVSGWIFLWVVAGTWLCPPAARCVPWSCSGGVTAQSCEEHVLLGLGSPCVVFGGFREVRASLSRRYPLTDENKSGYLYSQRCWISSPSSHNFWGVGRRWLEDTVLVERKADSALQSKL